MSNQDTGVPTMGYKLVKWDMAGTYRATALAYMQREGLNEVEHNNGRWYTISQVKDAMIY